MPGAEGVKPHSLARGTQYHRKALLPTRFILFRKPRYSTKGRVETKQTKE
ncbi:hypothetical protein KCP75_15350 [Salmonella enterica subsp. enterica]|nr:hypothetical protein KCP75_15350 [Salmonella enterica subsp. enterica]